MLTMVKRSFMSLISVAFPYSFHLVRNTVGHEASGFVPQTQALFKTHGDLTGECFAPGSLLTLRNSQETSFKAVEGGKLLMEMLT